MHCLSLRSLTLRSAPSVPTISQTVAGACSALPEKVCDLVSEYVGENARRGLPALRIDTRDSRIERSHIDTPVLNDPITDNDLGQDSHQTEAQTDHPDIGQGVLLGQNFLIDSIDLLAMRQKSQLFIKRSHTVLALMKWQFLFDQIYYTDADARQNLDNLVVFKDSLARVGIDDLLMYLPRVVPILGEDLRKATLLEFHLLLDYKNFSKALFLTDYGLAPAQLEDYHYFRERGSDPIGAALMVVNHKKTGRLKTHPAPCFRLKASGFSLFKKS